MRERKQLKKSEANLPRVIDGVDRNSIMQMHREMVTIRTVENTVAESILRKEIGCPCHLYSGEEAVATGVCMNLRNDDWIYSSHRSHGHFIAKGGNIERLMAEIYCRRGGVSGGRGGSMHLSSPEIGFPGSSAIVSGTISLAVGSALAFKTMKTDRIVASFFGDGAADEGVFYESMNLAALYRLPVLFVCENNLYSTHMPISECLANTNLIKKAEAMGVRGIRIDGNNVIGVFKTVKKLVGGMRNGQGPRFVECMTYRHRGHVGPNYDIDKGLRSKDELDLWMKRDPIDLLERKMIKSKIATVKDLDRIRDEIRNRVEAARNRAKNAPWPSCKTDKAFNEASWRVNE